MILLSFPRQLYAKLLFWASRLRSCGVGAGGEGAVDAWKSGADGRWKSGKKRRKEEIGRGEEESWGKNQKTGHHRTRRCHRIATCIPALSNAGWVCRIAQLLQHHDKESEAETGRFCATMSLFKETCYLYEHHLYKVLGLAYSVRFSDNSITEVWSNRAEWVTTTKWKGEGRGRRRKRKEKREEKGTYQIGSWLSRGPQ